MEVDFALVSSILTLLLTVGASVLGAKYKKGKDKLAKVVKVLTDVVEAAEDDEISEEELRRIAVGAKDVLDDFGLS